VSAGPIWGVLGIAPTRDERAIRSAYAIELKALNVDADPDAYQELRAARDFALHQARSSAVADASDVGLDDPFETEDAPTGDMIIADALPLDEDRDQDLQDQHQRLTELLFVADEDGNFYRTTPDEDEALLACFASIVTNAKLESIDSLAGASEWFADAIARAMPRSDILIDPAARAFGWQGRDEIGASPAIAFVMRRLAALRFIAAVEARGHRFHRAWRELTQPANEGSKRGWFVRTARVKELLGVIRSRHPTLEGQLDWYRVSLWEHHNGALPSTRIIVFGFILLFNIVRYAADNGPANPVRESSSSSSLFTAPDPLSDEHRDISEVLGNLTNGELGATEMEAKNPKAYRWLATNWSLARDNGDRRPDYVMRNTEILRDRLLGTFGSSSIGVLRDQIALRQAIARQLSYNPRACADYLRGKPSVDMPTPAVAALQRALVVRELIEHDPTKTVKKLTGHRFTIDDALIGQAAAHAGLAKTSVGKAMRYQGNDRSICAGRIAFFAELMKRADPADDRLIRSMVAG